MSSDKELLMHIKNRTRAENKMISLERILKVYNMEMYFKSCGDRIANLELIDNEHIQVDFINFPNLLFDSEGIEKCFDILSGYVDGKELIGILEYARIDDKMTEYINNQIDILKKFDIKTLFTMGFRTSKVKKDFEKIGKSEEFNADFMKKISMLSRTELFSRTPFNKARIWIVERIMDLYVKIRYRNIFLILKKCASEIT